MSYFLIFIILSLIITLHELGHLSMAKWLGIPVARFSVGFGPKLWGFKLKETEYWISAIPCGGYVLPALQDAESFGRLPLLTRILFSLGGPVANILGAFVCLAGMNAVHSGVSIASIIYLPLEQIGTMAMQLVTSIPMLFSQPDQISGIVGIVAAGGAHVGLDFGRLVQFSVLLNLNLAIFNMLPILPLDGGKIVMGVLHKIYRPLRKLELPLAVGGWVALLTLMLYATAHDIIRLAHGVLA